VLSQAVVCAIRNKSAPASRNSCKASAPDWVLPPVGGPGEKPMGKTFRPLMTSTLSELMVTSEPL